ncbi:riboflavin biosynthesis pyrimidine reductase [Cryobacterium sp. MP_M5]|uniref:pyrimidine reductase family protein n=1 Tax=unclassified Cryobacterium TaxID=2649013 RepID=UPI0018C9A54E|nr:MULTISPECIES: pyrimidine reductase family protein [unclassified Cryobacterium]MBG6057196.1 riboflavin biosynthesis pyrimidine reductase [Cryobacterium sp. MP_M3]MEC5175395.1 riboflavin biosynthesis pyrimidine reductase [Cryobacterium sp. MP_M5]
MLDQAELIRRYRVADRAETRVRLNFITSLDGAATVDGLSGGLGNEDDKLVFDTLRLLSDVIVVGAGTVRAEGYGGIRLSPADAAWRLGHGLPPQVPVAVVSSRLELEPEHPFFRDAAVRPIVVTHAASPAGRRAELAEVADVLVCGEEDLDPTVMVAALAARGLSQILCEGGPHLFGALIAADCVDELCLTISPVLEGGAAGRIARGGSGATRPMGLLHVLTAGDMLFLRYGRRPA